MPEHVPVNVAAIKSLSDADYIDRVMDPVMRPLIDDLSKRMPKNCMDFIKKWVLNPPPLNVALYERRRYYDVILAPIVHSLCEEAIKRKPGDVLHWLRDLVEHIEESAFSDNSHPPLAYKDVVASDDKMLELLKKALDVSSKPVLGGGSVAHHLSKMMNHMAVGKRKDTYNTISKWAEPSESSSSSSYLDDDDPDMKNRNDYIDAKAERDIVYDAGLYGGEGGTSKGTTCDYSGIKKKELRQTGEMMLMTAIKLLGKDAVRNFVMRECGTSMDYDKHHAGMLKVDGEGNAILGGEIAGPMAVHQQMTHFIRTYQDASTLEANLQELKRNLAAMDGAHHYRSDAKQETQQLIAGEVDDPNEIRKRLRQEGERLYMEHVTEDNTWGEQSKEQKDALDRLRAGYFTFGAKSKSPIMDPMSKKGKGPIMDPMSMKGKGRIMDPMSMQGKGPPNIQPRGPGAEAPRLDSEMRQVIQGTETSSEPLFSQGVALTQEEKLSQRQQGVSEERQEEKSCRQQ